MGQDQDTDPNFTSHHDRAPQNHTGLRNGNSTIPSYHSGIELSTRKVGSTENLAAGRLRHSVDGANTSHHTYDLKPSPTLDDGSWGVIGSSRNGEDASRQSVPHIDGKPVEENSKWIHRDKLAKIESEELQAAGIIIPRTRNHSRQRRDRSRSAMRRGTDASETNHGPRSRKNSTTLEPRNHEPAAEIWDLRTPEEIAEEETNAYFTPTSHKGGSRIPVAKVSPAPIPVDCFGRGSTGARKTSESPEGEALLTNQKTRSRSASMLGSDRTSVHGTISSSRRSVTEGSPKKGAPGTRKTSGPGKPGTATGRPKTRSGSTTKESNGSISTTRPSTRSGELSAGTKAPEGDPPWMINTYKPDPRLPPDQQLLPTVARRLQQEKWEKEGKFGDVYDKDFRPLNDNVLSRPPELENSPAAEDEQDREKDKSPAEDEWPLKLEPTKSPTQRLGNYSTMPKISDKHHSPIPSPRTPITPITPHPPPQEQARPQPVSKATVQSAPPAEDDKGGCGCCVVM